MILLYDGSLEGFFTAIFIIFHEKITPYSIEARETFGQDLFHPARPVTSDSEKAHRVLMGIRNRISREALNIVTRAFLSEGPGVENLLWEYIKLGFKIGPTVTAHLANPVVNTAARWSRKVVKEYHRWLGLVRFRLLTDGTYYAPIEPEGNILPLLPPHFLDRFPDQRWVIHDVKRNTALFHNGGKIELARILDSPEISGDTAPLCQEELFYSQLWRRYYGAIAIKNRSNPGLRIQFMPKRTWKYLPEMEETPGTT